MTNLLVPIMWVIWFELMGMTPWSMLVLEESTNKEILASFLL